jgi:hypothetical protein
MSKQRKSLVRQLDKAFGDFIKARDKRCVTCGAVENLQCGHLFSRVAYSTRWDEKNAFCQCRSCNMRHEYDPGPLTVYFLERFGPDVYAELHRKHKTLVKYSDSILSMLIQHFRTARAALMVKEMV